MTLISKNWYINELNDLVSKYNNIYHRTIKAKPADVNSNTCFKFSVEMIEILN